jgi:hypothetical protein
MPVSMHHHMRYIETHTARPEPGDPSNDKITTDAWVYAIHPLMRYHDGTALGRTRMTTAPPDRCRLIVYTIRLGHRALKRQHMYVSMHHHRRYIETQTLDVASPATRGKAYSYLTLLFH